MNRKLYLILIIFVCRYSIAQLPVFNVTAHTTASTGYYFLCNYKLSGYPTFPAGTQTQTILDARGNVIYYRPVAGYFAGDFKILPNGLISFWGGNGFHLMDSSFNIIDTISLVGSNYDDDIHDLQLLPNGHYLLLGTENIHMDLSNHFIFNHNHSPGSSNATVMAGIVQELDANKNVVFEWHSIDYLNIDDADEFFMTNTSNVDWTHMNAVELDTDGNILISSRHLSEVTKINRSDSSVMWRMGGKANQFTFTNDTTMFLAQHDVRRNPDGTISIFDNGRNSNPIHPASSKFYSVDEINHEVTLVRSHKEGSSKLSYSQGNTQLLPNGNILTSYGNLFPPPIVFNVVDSSDNKVFEIIFPDSQITYRSYNFPSLPFHQPTLSCFQDSSGHFHLKTDSTFSSHKWSTGANSSTIQINAPDTFYAFVPWGNTGGFVRTETVIVSDMLHPCSLNDITSLDDHTNFNLYPNPASEYISIHFENNTEKVVEIYDNVGRQIQVITSKNQMMKINTSSFKPGVYLVKVGAMVQRFMVM